MGTYEAGKEYRLGTHAPNPLLGRYRMRIKGAGLYELRPLMS